MLNNRLITGLGVLMLMACGVFVNISLTACGDGKKKDSTLNFYQADDPLIRYTGRIDFSDKLKPKFWQPGVYIEWAFEGDSCILILEDEMLWGDSHNYFELVVDGKEQRLQMKTKRDTILVATDAGPGIHRVFFCKNTEAGIGYMRFAGISCQKLVPLPPPMKRKIEFIGNSITSGMGSDESEIPCGKGVWYDQHNAYQSYGAIAARSMNAQYHLSSVSGIGLMHSCCEMKVIMPQVFDKVNMRDDSVDWNFTNYQPDVVSVCLGQNDGIQDSATFCSNYILFIKTLRKHYPSATIVCLTSPMANDQLMPVLKKYLAAITKEVNKADSNVHTYFFSKRYSRGCGEHPSLEEHQEIAGELTVFLRELMKW
ncbi:GDSL-type esterase/lipase family protein [Terrimonas sp. NA20]|uniref:GDSL-type esterase/lipase family protein n=1 Tax=Terrimonas ginsenosidimutans TaxID=2908004 RepID=A0ABS9KQ39_9BACT|nr:SGNH/GDSL hydrolase family protein [Terrimonas ginsenosidimutans]MCG2614385.1 GDSL-type esterase/lipase family protein [Terrimonas ginsenosidimutans]